TDSTESTDYLAERLAKAAQVTGKPQCNVCGGKEFASIEEQRRHYKTQAHESNLVRKLIWRREHPDVETVEGEYPWQPVLDDDNDDDEQSEQEDDGSAWSESDVSAVDDAKDADNNELVVVLGNHGRATMDAETLAEELEGGRRKQLGWLERASGESSDEDEDEDEGRSRHKSKNYDSSSPWLWFAASDQITNDQTPTVAVYGIHRRILVPRGQHGIHTSSDQILRDLRAMQLPVAPKQLQLEHKNLDDSSSIWVILATNGGYFAGAVFDNQTGLVIAHKTFQRYTTRRKQGGSQMRQDNAMGRLANSAGAQIRRYNEQKLQEEIRELMVQWREYLRMSSCVLVRVARTQQKGFFGLPKGDGGGAGQVLQWSDPRVRSVSVPMGRPTLAELQRVYRELTTVRIRTAQRSEVFENCKVKGNGGDDKTNDSQELQPEQIPDTAVTGDSESEHTLDAEPRPDLLAFLHHVAKMIMSLEETFTDQQIVDYLDQNISQLLDALSDPAIGLRYLQDTEMIQAHKTPTLLHLASSLGRFELVPYLMDHGEDPTVTNGWPPLFANGQTAFEVARDQATRDAFFAYRLENLGDADNAIEWQRSGMPDKEQEQEQQRDLEHEARVREKKRRERERKKAREKAKKQQKAQEDSERADDAALEQAQSENKKSTKPRKEKKLESLSQSELRARMLSMAYASAGSWGSSSPSSAQAVGSTNANANAKTEQRPVSPDTQRARDRELRFQAAERRRLQQQQNQDQNQNLRNTGECTHCGKLLHGLVPFEQFDWKCCSLKCLQDHRTLMNNN
ncbi:hypothetical protein LPJ64_006204, partial [Coemansia asiatica]